MASHLTLEERDRIACLRHQGCDQKEIATDLGRAGFTICRGLQTNSRAGSPRCWLSITTAYSRSVMVRKPTRCLTASAAYSHTRSFHVDRTILDSVRAKENGRQTIARRPPRKRVVAATAFHTSPAGEDTDTAWEKRGSACRAPDQTWAQTD